MFDIGFAELVLVGVVGLLVIGPERLPEAIRTGSHWLRRFKRSFDDIKREVQQELHNDEVMQQLRKTGEQFKNHAGELTKSLDGTAANLAKTATSDPPSGDIQVTDSNAPTADKKAE